MPATRSLEDWGDLLPQADLELYQASGYGRSATFGRRPALLVVDVTYNFTGDRGSALLESIRKYAFSCGESAWRAVDAIAELLVEARRSAIPVIYTAPAVHRSAADAGRWSAKTERVEESGGRGSEIVAEIAPIGDEMILRKPKPSAFFATDLISRLVGFGVDSLLLCGGTTSGCVRATAVDAFSFNYPVAIVEEGVFDRSTLVHRLNLFDLHAKYAEVVSLGSAKEYVRSAR
ncbi:MAG TPA: isochorismatase family protein [Candidatus Micrarchaeaceae archaeon]|nr:isochorismatase family protein [Candidatus Micrarchaeaceae archaeon]